MLLEPGDIMACYGTDRVSRTIRWGTASLFGPARLRLGPSHVALIVPGVKTPLWLESTSLCHAPCLYHGAPRAGVQLHKPETRIPAYTDSGGRVDVYRLAPLRQLIGPDLERLGWLTRRVLENGANYDTGGALLSGTRVLKFSRLLPGADLESLFCSELVAEMLMALGRLNDANPGVYNPASLLRTLVRLGNYRFERSIRAWAVMEHPDLKVFVPEPESA